MVIKITGEEHVVCDCKGDTTDQWVDRLLVRITRRKDRVTVNIFCPDCTSSMIYEVTSRLILESHTDFQTD